MQSAVGAGRRALGRRTAATGGVSVRGAWGASRRNDSGPGVGAAQRALVRTWSAQQGRAARTCAAHGGHTEEGVGALGYAWRRMWPSRIGGASPGSERRGGTANRRTAVMEAGSTCIPHGVGRCLGTRAACWPRSNFRGVVAGGRAVAGGACCGGAEISGAGNMGTMVGSSVFWEELNASGYQETQIYSGESEGNCRLSEHFHELLFGRIFH
ncbi:hypothetical protein B0H14DRAFT_2607391 [Mycena olivaceomarginata]|nr:hypothetical protein B0H14DRAFT_2607391 [Mycena olivaceomarginata]